MPAITTSHRSAEGWLYGAFVIDAWSRRVLGWSLAGHCRTDLVVDALQMALWAAWWSRRLHPPC